MKYLLLVNVGVSIGSVQEFIGSARRTRDLHFGSWLLSELSRAAAQKIYNLKGVLIFPAPAPEDITWLQPNNEFNVANRILALIDLEHDQEPRSLAEQVHETVNQRLSAIWKEACGNIRLPAKQREDAEKQINDLVEFVWVSLPYNDNGENNYRETRKQLEALMAARKNTHNFQRVAWGASVPKSSTDGQLESVIPEEEYPSRIDSETDKMRKLQDLYTRYGAAGPAERLSGVDLLKRFGTTAFDDHFPRTSHIAALPFLQRTYLINSVEQAQLRAQWTTYIEKLNDLAIAPLKEHISATYPSHPILERYDGALLFEDRLTDLLRIPTTDKRFSDRSLQARNALHEFYASLDTQFSKIGPGKKRPSTYYALLQADGDGMGTLIDELAEYGHEQHRKLSQALSRFAKHVRVIIEGHQGALVYAGGDDVLAFLPLHTMLQCAHDLAKSFSAELKSITDQRTLPLPTLSVGIAIVHHLDSLSEARRLAHDAEQRAKRKSGKNALAITLSKRGGEDYSIVGTWDNIDTRLAQLVAYCRTGSISGGTPYELRDLVLRLSVPKTDPQYDTLQEIIRVDTLRILLRKLSVLVGKLSSDEVKGIERFLRMELGLPQEDTSNEPHIPQVSTEMFINELIIAQILADAEELAQLRAGVKV
jgi:CRISPR-associated protein Cmr2